MNRSIKTRRRKKESLATKLSLFLLAAIVITVTTTLGVVFWLSNKHNTLAELNSVRMVAGGLKALEKSLSLETQDYAFWIEGNRHIVAEDAEAMTSAFGPSVHANRIFDLFLVSRSQEGAQYGWVIGEAENVLKDLIPDPLLHTIRNNLIEQNAGIGDTTHLYEQVSGKFFMLSAAFAGPDPNAEFDPLSQQLIIIGYQLGKDRLEELGRQFLIEDIRIDSKPSLLNQEDQLSIPIVGPYGASLAYISWRPEQPGDSVLSAALGPLLAALAIVTLLGLLITRWASSAAQSLADKEAESFWAARTDTLTNLPNRWQFLNKLGDREVQLACQNNRLAIVLLDINGFKYINNAVGTAGGDELIRQVADRLRDSLHSNQFLARVGGNEFSVLLTALNPEETATEFARLCQDILKQEFILNGKALRISASIGFASCQGFEINTYELRRRANVALFESKRRGTGLSIGYETTQDDLQNQNKDLEYALGKAIDQGEIYVEYQPIVSSSERRFSYAEALARWQSKDFGQVRPDVFISLAERAGLINALGQCIQRKILADMKNWPKLKVSFNVSPMELGSPDFAETLIQQTEEFGVEPNRLEIELTEGIVVNHPEFAREKLEVLRNTGYSIALDDFGTGFSSIGYLRKMPFDKLKIDRSFIKGIEATDDAMTMLKSMATLGKSLHMRIVAEGIETLGEALTATSCGCDLLQGYHFSKPLPYAELREKFSNDEAENADTA